MRLKAIVLGGFDYFWDKINKCYNEGSYYIPNSPFDININMMEFNISNLKKDIELPENANAVAKRNGTISIKIETGGYSGGSCWNDDPAEPYETGNSISYDDFKEALKNILNNALGNKTYTFGSLDELLDILFKDPWKWGIYENTDTEYEYYGNSTDYMFIEISLWNLYKFLSKYDAFF